MERAFYFEGWDPSSLEHFLLENLEPGDYWAVPVRLRETGCVICFEDRALSIRVPCFRVWALVYGWRSEPVRLDGIVSEKEARRTLKRLGCPSPEELRQTCDDYRHSWESRTGRSIITIQGEWALDQVA